MQAAAGHEPQSGVKCACSRETTTPMSSWQDSPQRHSTVFVHARMKPQPHGKAAYYVTYLCQQCSCSGAVCAAGCAIGLESYSTALLHAWTNHICARRAERALHPVGTQSAGRINYNHVTIAHTPLTTTCIAREWQGPNVAPARASRCGSVCPLLPLRGVYDDTSSLRRLRRNGRISAPIRYGLLSS